MRNSKFASSGDNKYRQTGIMIVSFVFSHWQIGRMQTLFLLMVITIGVMATARDVRAYSMTQVPDKIVVGVPISLSGQLSTEGQQASWGIQSATKWVNDVKGGVQIGGSKVKLELKIYDDESKKETVQSLLERLAVTDKVDVILAPYSSGLTLAGAPIAEKYGKLYLSHGGASDRIFEQNLTLAVQVLSVGSVYMLGALDMLGQLDPSAKRLAFISEDEEFTISVMNGARARATQLGYQIVFDQKYPSNPTDLTPLLSSLKNSNPDAILGGGHFKDGQLMVTQLSDLKIGVKMLSLLVAPSFPDFYTVLGKKAEGVIAPGQWEVGATYGPDAAKTANIEWFGLTQNDFLSTFKSVSNGKDPAYQAAEAAASVLVYVRGVEMGGKVNAVDVRAALGKMHIMTFFGDFMISKEGKQTGHQMIWIQWQNGKKVIVWPRTAQNAQPVYPMSQVTVTAVQTGTAVATTVTPFQAISPTTYAPWIAGLIAFIIVVGGAFYLRKRSQKKT